MGWWTGWTDFFLSSFVNLIMLRSIYTNALFCFIPEYVRAYTTEIQHSTCAPHWEKKTTYTHVRARARTQARTQTHIHTQTQTRQTWLHAASRLQIPARIIVSFMLKFRADTWPTDDFSTTSFILQLFISTVGNFFSESYDYLFGRTSIAYSSDETDCVRVRYHRM